MLIDDLLQSELPDDAPIESTDAVLASVSARVRMHHRNRRFVVVAVAAVVVAIVPLLAARLTRSSPTSVDTVGVDSDALLTDRWIIDGLSPKSIQEQPLSIGETLEIYGHPDAAGIGLDKWVALSVSNARGDRNVAVGFANEPTRSSILDGHEIGIVTWQDQTQLAFTDDERRLVFLSGRGIPTDDLLALAQRLTNADPAAYTIAGADVVRDLPTLVASGPNDDRPLQVSVNYGAQRLFSFVSPRGGELLLAVRPLPSDPGAIERVGSAIGWRHQSEGRDWISYIDGTVVSVAGADPLDTQRLRHPTKAEWDALLVTSPPATAALTAGTYAGWRNFGLADPCDLLKEALNATPGDNTWRFALQRYAQRIEQLDYADQANQLAQRSDTNARNDITTLLQARQTPNCK